MTRAGNDGAWTLASTTSLPIGLHAFVASATDQAGNVSLSSVPYLLTIDTTAPAVAITRSGPDVLTIGATSTVTFVLSEPVSTFTAANVQASGGSLSAFSGSGATYSVIFTPLPGFHGIAEVAIAPEAFRDPAGQPNAGVALGIPVDTTSPTTTLAVVGRSRLTAGETTQVVFTLSEPSPDFGPEAVVVTGGSLGLFQAAGNQYLATFTPQIEFRGSASITVPAGCFTDVNANPNTSGNALTIAIDTVVPRIHAFSAALTTATLGIGDSLPLEARITDPVTPGGRFMVAFDSGGGVELVVDESGLVAHGTYRVQAGETSRGLEVVGVTTIQPIGNEAGNPFATGTPWAGARLSDRHTIIVDGGVRFMDAGAFSINPSLVRDVRSQFRTVPIRFTTPVRGVSLGNFVLTLNGQRLPLIGAQVRGTGTTYSLQLPLSRVNPVGIYRLTVIAGSGIRALSNGASATTEVSLYWGYSRSVGMVPDAPMAVTAIAAVSSATQKSVVLSWRPPSGNAGGNITRYEIQFRTIGSTGWVTTRLSVPGSVTAATVQGLTVGLTYEFRVGAANSAGLGAFGVSAPFRVA
jgi:hypothetical protein